MKKIITIMLLVLVGLSVQAQVKKNKNAKYVTEVNGNCEQCQKRIQKAAFSVHGVKSAVWKIETHQLNVILNEEKCSLLDVKKAFIDSLVSAEGRTGVGLWPSDWGKRGGSTFIRLGLICVALMIYEQILQTNRTELPSLWG